MKPLIDTFTTPDQGSAAAPPTPAIEASKPESETDLAASTASEGPSEKEETPEEIAARRGPLQMVVRLPF